MICRTKHADHLLFQLYAVLSALRQQGLYQIALFIQDTAARMVLQQMAVFPQRPEESGVERLRQGAVPDIDIRVGGERTRLCAAVGIDMEEAAPCRHTAA